MAQSRNKIWTGRNFTYCEVKERVNMFLDNVSLVSESWKRVWASGSVAVRPDAPVPNVGPGLHHGSCRRPAGGRRCRTDGQTRVCPPQ